MRPPFPQVLDNTMISAFKACPRKFQLEYLDHWKPKLQSVHLHAGASYAKGLEVARTAFFQDGKPESDSVAAGLEALIKAYGNFECPSDSAKSLERMCGAYEFYMDQYPMPEEKARPHIFPSGKHGIEFSFVEPIDLRHPETGDPLLYCGRMDEVVDFAGGIFGEDDKTTSQLGASWPKQWDLRAQFTGYCWGAERAGIPLQGFLIRGVSILKTKYDTLQAVTYRSPWMIERWYAGLLRTISRMMQCWEEGVWDYDESDACSAYGGCLFRQPCLSADPQPWLEGSFVKRIWDPVNRKEEEA